jgi:D-glycero-D-manno-heptose 1,7-bisphosphate phosphatase
LKRPALFLDRDGVINLDRGYVIEADQFEFIEDIFEVCRCAQERGYLLFVVTNQAGIGRGYFTEQEFLKLTEWMCAVFQTNGVPLDKVFYCPFHPEGIEPYRIDSPFRKPAPGMILQAAREYGLDLPHSVLVGDKETDIQAGLAAGIGCNLLYHLCLEESADCRNSAATAVIEKLAEVIPYLKSC